MVAKHSSKKSSCLPIKKPLMGDASRVNLAFRKAKSVTKKTTIKFIDLDLLKILVIINCFCIFAHKYTNYKMVRKL